MKKLFVLIVILVGLAYALYLWNVNLRLFDDARYAQIDRIEDFRLVVESTMPEKIRCYEEPSTSDSLPELNARSEQKLLGTRRNIFFLETSCFGKGGQAQLNCRKACSVEAAARTNPNMLVNLFYLSPAPPSDLAKRLLQHLLTYDNVQVCRVMVADYIRDTPIEHWYSSGILAKSSWPNIHMSDFLRLLTLWKYGGIYMDLDVVAITPLDNLTNFVGRQFDARSNSAVLGLASTGVGFEAASECLSDLMRTYRGDSWDDSSCGVLNRVTQKICATKNFTEMTIDRCGGFQVFPPATLYPVSYGGDQLKQFFTSTNDTAKMMQRINAARTIHIWNQLSKHLKVVKGSPYAQIAQKYCPLIYNHCDNEF